VRDGEAVPALLTEPDQQVDAWAAVVVDAVLEVHRHLGPGRVDVLVARVLVVELKALPTLLPAHTSQVISYLKTTGLSLCLLLNFGERHLKTGIRRIVLSRLPLHKTWRLCGLAALL
jgi:hypothetical protein